MVNRIGLVIALAFLGFVCAEGYADTPPHTGQRPAASPPPEPKKFGKPTLSHEMRGNRADVLTYVDIWLAEGGHAKAGEQLKGVEARFCSTKKELGGGIAIDRQACTKVTPGQEKQLLANLAVGRAIILVQEVNLLEEQFSDPKGWPRGKQYGGDLNRIDLVHVAPSNWWLMHYRYALRAEWIDWKARQFIGRCEEYCNPKVGYGFADKEPANCLRVWRRCNDLDLLELLTLPE